MSRRRAAVKRTLLKDPKYNDTLVSKFVCSLMKHGKKSVAERILYGALDLISDREKETPSLDVFRTAVENVKPAMEVKSRRVGGSTYQVPMQVRSSRSQSLAIRWLVLYANARSGNRCRLNLPTSCWMPSTTVEVPSRKKKIPSRWQKPIRLLLTIAGNFKDRCFSK